MTARKNTASEQEGKHLPGHHPNSQKALESTLWKPGESPNPKGRPKGSRNIRTILDEMLHRYVDVEALKHLKGIDATVELCKQLCDAKNDTRQDGDPKERARLYDLIVGVANMEGGASGGVSTPHPLSQQADDEALRIEQAEHLLVSYPCVYDTRVRRITTVHEQGRQLYRDFQVIQLMLRTMGAMRSVWRMAPYRWSQRPRRGLHAYQQSLFDGFAP